jgi:hypothetical protein
MPIEVHCPNPVCARVHNVKNKYAGMRGKCPACGSWMYIPKTGAMPSIVAPRPAELEQSAARAREEARPAARKAEPARQPVAAAANHQPILSAADMALLPEPAEPKPAHARFPIQDEEPPAVAEAAEEPAETKPKKHFSWLAVLLMLLGIASLGAIAAAPYLQRADLIATGDLVNILPKPNVIDEASIPYVAGAPGVVAVLALLSLLMGLVTRRFGILNLFLLYLSLLCSAFLLLVALDRFHRDTKAIADLNKVIDKYKEQGKQGDAEVITGMQSLALAGGAAGACVFFTLAGVCMHRRTWSRMLGFMFLAFWPALVAAWVYRTELGIDTDLVPFDTIRPWLPV